MGCVTVTHPSLCTVKDNLAHGKPVAIYRTTISIIIFEMMYLALVMVCGYIIFQVDIIWIKLLGIIMAMVTLWACVQFLKRLKDRIVVTPSHLSLPNVEKQSKQEKHAVVQKVIIPWHDIEDINYTIEVKGDSKISIQRRVYIVLRNKTKYIIDPDFYDVFFLGPKLKSFWQQYGEKR